MAIDFTKFDKEVNKEQLQKDYKDAVENGGTGDYPEVPKGTYTAKIEAMEIKLTKTDKKPMFSAQLRILEGEFKKQCIFFNRKILGNKESEKWNDGKAIATVTGWLAKLETETVPEFETYSQFADCVLDIMEEVEEYALTLEVEYAPDAFNPITIKDVFEG